MKNNIVFMNYGQFEDEVHKKAYEYLANINEYSIDSFVKAAKTVAQSSVENYFRKVDDLYSEGILKIQDPDLLDEFMDFRNGYRAKMKGWVCEHKIANDYLNIPDYNDLRKSYVNLKHPIAIASIGTVVVVGLAVISNRLLFLVGEALVLGVAAHKYKKSKENVEKEYQQKKQEFVDRTIYNLENWLAQAEEYSNHLLESFGL